MACMKRVKNASHLMHRLKNRSPKSGAEPLLAQSVVVRESILAADSVQGLVDLVATAGVDFAGASGTFVTVDGKESSAGRDVDVPVELVVEANRERSMVAHGTTSAIPLQSAGTVVGLVVVEGGDPAALEILERAAGDAYVRLAARSSRFASADASATLDVDGLTGVGNRRRLDDDIARVAGTSAGEAEPISLAMFDIDSFHFYNEAHGKHAGNDILRSIADLIAKNLRETDVVYRYGGVRFVALLPGATVENAFQVVERIRHVVEQTTFVGEHVQPTGRITMSIGVAEAPTGESATLLSAADIALESAKKSGRNMVVAQPDQG